MTNFLVAACMLAFSPGVVRAQNPLTAFPKNYGLLLDNSAVEVIRVHYDAHERIGVHDHSSTPTVYVYLSNSGPVRFEHLEAHSFVLTRPPTTFGAFRVSPGRIERHSVENIGDTSSDFLRVELKQVPLGSLEPFRKKAPQSPLQSHKSEEYRTKDVRIERVICGGETGCLLEQSPIPSLIVTLTPSFVAPVGAERAGKRLDLGAVLWLTATQAASLTTASTFPAHILRIFIPTK